MNKEYIYIDGKAIIKDEKGNQKPVEYYDNLDDVLIQENLIETMENGIKCLEKESESFKKINKRRYFPIMVPMTIGIITIGIPAILYLLESGSSGLLTISIDTIYGQMSLTSVLRLLIGGPALLIATFVDFIFYKQNKENLKQEKGINNELEEIKIALS